MPSWFVYCPDLYIAPSLYLICVLPSSLDDTESQSSAEWKVNPLSNGRWFKLYIFIYIMNSSIFFSLWFFIRYIIVHICELSLISIGVHLLVEHQRHLKQNGNIHHVIILWHIYIYIYIYIIGFAFISMFCLPNKLHLKHSILLPRVCLLNMTKVFINIFASTKEMISDV